MTTQPLTQSAQQALNRTDDFNFDWRFQLISAETQTAFAHAHQPSFDDSDWRQLRLPHDWSIELPYNQEEGDGATGYLPGGLGWYRKRFSAEIDDNHLLFVLFDGIYNHSQVWLNGHPLGENPYGYSPFWFELTPHLNQSGDQLLAVFVDRHRTIDSRWYTGSGIYRDVKLIAKSRLHIPIWGTRITTPVISSTMGQVALDIELRNAFATPKAGTVRTDIVNAAGEIVASAEMPFSLQPHTTSQLSHTVSVPNPAMWHVDSPTLYRARITVTEGDTVHEVSETPFGFRTIRFDADTGFYLNGESMRIKGVCLHHDAGLVGSAVPDGVWRQRLQELKAMGCNAIRTAHNPSSEAFLNLCDEMGFLVQLEFFDEWDNGKDMRLNNIDRHGDEISRGYASDFQRWAEDDLKRTMRRDRNHPCIFQWSIGNEIEWTYPNYAKSTGYFDADTNGNYFWTLPPYTSAEIKARYDALPKGEYVLAKTAHKLAEWTREMDTTRPIVANCILPSASHVTGYADALDIVGYSYRQVMYDRGHADFPDKVIMGTENLGQWHEWQHVIERPFISGLFIWTGIDYIGESHDQWPRKAQPSGFLDVGGFRKPSFYMYQSLWRSEPVVFIATQTLPKSLYELEQGALVEKQPDGWRQRLWEWHDVNTHWNYAAEEMTVVEVYANCPEVELFLNGRSLGRQRLQDHPDHIYKWAVAFEAGTLEARGTDALGRDTTFTLQTANKPSEIRLTAESDSLQADGYDMVRLIAQLHDDAGVTVKHTEREIVFDVDGPCRVLGVDNGSSANVQPHQSNRITTSQGRALLLLQAEQETGKLTVTVSAEGLRSHSVTIPVTGATPHEN